MPDPIDISKRFTRHPLEPGAVLDGLRERDLKVLCAVGLDEDGELYVASSSGDPHLDFWLFHRAASRVLELALSTK